MLIQLRFFASIREALGISQESISVPDEIGTLGELRLYLAQRDRIWGQALGADKVLRMALNHHMTGADTPLVEGGEVAFFPPVTGG